MVRADYAPSASAGGHGGVIAYVAPHSPAWRGGLVAGDVVVAAEGHTVRDVLDFQWYSDGDTLALQVLDHSGTQRLVELTRASDEVWGIEYKEPLFDGMRICRNNCAFCFMSQLPTGLRSPLYVRDDDFRLSFLSGNFVTLTNLTDDDVARISEQRLSPLYVSLHAVDPEVRRTLVCAHDDRTLERIDALLDEAIDLHVQIVLVPGVNDGDVLQRSLTWLAEREGIVSVGIVPLGFTRHQERFSASYEVPEAARAVIESVEPWQMAMRDRDGASWVYLADEFYLDAGEEVPPWPWYDGFPQYENGIGIVRSLVDDAAGISVEIGEVAHEAALVTRPVVVSGAMGAPVLARVIARAGAHTAVLPVENRFFGGNVSVAGLLTGEDLIRAITDDLVADGRPGGYLLPDLVFNSDGVTLDGHTLESLRTESGADVRVVSSDAAGLVAGLAGLIAQPPHQPKE